LYPVMMIIVGVIEQQHDDVLPMMVVMGSLLLLVVVVVLRSRCRYRHVDQGGIHLDELGQAKGGWDTARRHPRIGLEKCATLRREKVRRGWTPSPHHRGGTDRWSRGPVRVGARYWSGTEGRISPQKS
jgi:hypothetical protein